MARMVDTARWFFVSKDVATHMDFDMKLARAQDNNNPEDPELMNDRLALTKATMITLKRALELIGVSAPEKM